MTVVLYPIPTRGIEKRDRRISGFTAGILCAGRGTGLAGNGSALEDSRTAGAEIGCVVQAVVHIINCLFAHHLPGCLGIVQDQLALGGYEVGSFRFRRIQQYVDNADWHLITSTVENLKLLADEDDA